jgi:hypothetical protein
VAGSIHGPRADPDGPDGGFELAEGATPRGALATWQAEIARAREVCAARSLTDTGRLMGQEVSLRWIYVHRIEEYARHHGHADLVRERIDGSTGVQRGRPGEGAASYGVREVAKVRRRRVALYPLSGGGPGTSVR